LDIKQRNERYLCIEVAFFGVLSGIVGTFLSVYALRLGATSQDIGLLSALPALVTLVFLIPAGRFLERYHHILRPTVVVGLVQRLQYLLVALVVLVPVALRVPALIAIIAIGAMAAATGSVAFTVMFGQIVPAADRARVVSVRSLLASLTSAVAALLAGQLLELHLLPFPWNYSALFAAGFAFSLVSLWYVSRLSVPPIVQAEPAQPAARSLSIRQTLGVVRQTRPFVRYTVATFVANWAVSLPIPLYALFWVHVLNMGESWIGAIVTLGSLVPMFVFPLWARVAERFGNRAMMAIGCIGIGLFPITTALSPSPEFLLIPAIIGGILTPPWSLGLYNGLFEVIPAQQQPTYISVHTAAMNLAAFTAPLLSAAVLVPLIGIIPALIVGGVARMVGGVVMYAVLKRGDAASSA
jgi:MFS family permease